LQIAVKNEEKAQEIDWILKISLNLHTLNNEY